MRKSKRTEMGGILLSTLYFWAIPFSFVTSLYAADPTEGDKEAHSHEAALQVATEDPVLKEQIAKVTEGLQTLHRHMAQRRQAIQKETDAVRKAALYVELDGLRREHDALERLLHELVEEAKSTEWTTIDEALKRVRPTERYNEKETRKEEVLRDRRE